MKDEFKNLPANPSPDEAPGGKSPDEAPSPRPAAEYETFWHSLIGEKAAAAFVDQSIRTMQSLRQRGGGPKYVRLSARSIKYRRIDLRAWVEAKLVSSTSDPGLEAQPSDDGTEPATELHTQTVRQTGDADNAMSQEGAGSRR